MIFAWLQDYLISSSFPFKRLCSCKFINLFHTFLEYISQGLKRIPKAFLVILAVKGTPVTENSIQIGPLKMALLPFF